MSPLAAPVASVNVVEAALASALERAAAAGEWNVVALLAGELAARRTAATPLEGVVDLEAERRRRGR